MKCHWKLQLIVLSMGIQLLGCEVVTTQTSPGVTALNHRVLPSFSRHLNPPLAAILEKDEDEPDVAGGCPAETSPTRYLERLSFEWVGCRPPPSTVPGTRLILVLDAPKQSPPLSLA